VTENTANAPGGGLYIAPPATVYLDAFTLANIVNKGVGAGNDIYGSYTVIP
jgi:hypothetical protein